MAKYCSSDKIAIGKKIHLACGIFVVLFALSECVYIVYWVASQYDVPEQMERLNKEHHEWQCRFCHSCRRKLLEDCDSCLDLLDCHPPPEVTRKHSSLSRQCIAKKEVQTYVTSIIDNEFSRQEERSGINEKNISFYLKRVEQKLYPGRFLVQWYLDPSGNQKQDDENWTTITRYVTQERHRVVLPGSRDTYHKGGVKAPRDGLYLIITRLTFSCVKTSKLPQVISVQTYVYETEIHQRNLMSEDETVPCSDKEDLGDVTTMYSSGLFRLVANNVIYIQYKSSHRIQLSRDSNSRYKSSIGVVWIGLS